MTTTERMNLANLENALERLRLADDGVCVHIQDAIDSVESAIREAVEALPVIATQPAVEVGSMWRNDDVGTRTVESVDVESDRVNWVGGGFDFLSTLRDNYTEVRPLTADDISDAVWDAWLNSRVGKDGIAAAINEWRKENDK